MTNSKNILVTGGCGFIGSCFVKKQIAKGNFVLNIDKLTYAGSPANVEAVATNPNYRFTKADINETALIQNLLNYNKIDWVVNFAAESHVDNSISGPGIFVQTNINGTYSMLQASLNYYKNLNGEKKNDFRFLHVSTDEVLALFKKMMSHLMKIVVINQTRLIPLPKPLQTIWFGLGKKLINCRPSLPIAPIILDHFNIVKN